MRPLKEAGTWGTKRFNEQVKNNIAKFDADFMFQLTKEEWENLRSKGIYTAFNADCGECA